MSAGGHPATEAEAGVDDSWLRPLERKRLRMVMLLMAMTIGNDNNHDRYVDEDEGNDHNNDNEAADTESGDTY